MQYIIKHKDKQYKAEADDILLLLAAVMRKFDWPDTPIMITPENSDDYLLYAPDKESRDREVRCDFDKFYWDHITEIQGIINTIERLDKQTRKYILF